MNDRGRGTIELDRMLRETPLFSHLSEKQLDAVAKAGSLVEFESEEVIVQEGDAVASFYVILEGQVEVRHADSPLATLGRGQFFGETTLVPDQTRSADVIAVKHTSCLALGGSELRELIILNPTVALKILEESTRRNRPRVSDVTRSSLPSGSATGVSMEFKSSRTRALFDYLVNSFIEDYMRKKYAMEHSGWRGLVESARAIHVSPSLLYDRLGRASIITGELAKRGFVETRIFPGERGRGGEITRVRIAYEKQPIMEYVKAKVRRG